MRVDFNGQSSKKVERMRQSHTTTSKLNRSNKCHALLGPRFDGVLEQGRVADRGISQRRNERPIHSRTMVVTTSKKPDDQGEKQLPTRDVTKNLPDRSIGVMNLGFDHVPKPVNIFLDIKHRQRHGASDP